MSLGYLRVLTAGESHGPQLTIFVQNLPAGLAVLAEDINIDLARRQKGYGRGGRQQIEHDCVEIVAGVRHGVTMGGPIAMVVKNRDWANWQGKMDIEPVADPPPPVTRLRPGHADLAGVVKYGLNDVRNVLERASARETASRVAAGGLAKVFLRQFGIEIRSQDERIATICQRLNHYHSFQCVMAERAFLRAMGGGCQSPVAAYAEVAGSQVHLRAVSFRNEPVRRTEGKADLKEAAQLGERLAVELLNP